MMSIKSYAKENIEQEKQEANKDTYAKKSSSKMFQNSFEIFFDKFG
jgi:hypothetical protein